MAVKKVQRGYIHFTDGRVVKVQPVNGKKFDYRELQQAVGGYIEPIIHAKKQGWTQMFANEEGMLKGLPDNPQTPQVVDFDVYLRNGYGRGWRVAGNIIGIKNEEAEENEFPTIAAAMSQK